MIRSAPALLAGLILIAGCTDSMDSITREYRNANNEGIDALMMIRTKEDATRIHARIFKSMTPRYAAIDEKLKIFTQNRSGNQVELAKEVLESDGVHLYLTDLQVNSQRFTLEKARLRQLFMKYYEEKCKERGEEGDDFTPDVRKIAPELYDMVFDSGHPVTTTLAAHFRGSEVVRLIMSFSIQNRIKTEPKFEVMFSKFEEKRKTFYTDRMKEIKLVE